MDATRLCLIRHGETAWNAERRIQGQLDLPLNPVGLAQARALAGRLAGRRFAALWSSDLARARCTAEPIAAALRLSIMFDTDLRERDFGLFQGLTLDEARARHPAAFARYAARDPGCDLGGGESLNRFATRALGCIERIVAAHRGGDILVVSHGGVLDAAHRRASGAPLCAARDFVILNARPNWIRIQEGRWSIESWASRDEAEPEAGAALDELR
jgi:probable phosphoglycerate mutase